MACPRPAPRLYAFRASFSAPFGEQFGGIPGLRPGPPARQKIRKCLCLGGFVGPAGSLDLGVWDQKIRPNAQGEWAKSGKMTAMRRAGAILHPLGPEFSKMPSN